MTGFSGTLEAGIKFSEDLQDAIRKQDSETILGWIVDLRRNTGGNMYPMLSGIGPVLVEGVAGFFIDADGHANSFSYRNGGAYFSESVLNQVANPYELINPNPKVAVLMDAACASSGKVIATAFSGRDKTRSFGQPTCGVSTGIAGFDLSDGSALGLAICFFADRNRKLFKNGITPDELTDPEQTIQKDTEWIRSE